MECNFLTHGSIYRKKPVLSRNKTDSSGSFEEILLTTNPLAAGIRDLPSGFLNCSCLRTCQYTSTTEIYNDKISHFEINNAFEYLFS
jgi:hypothetical protein